ncbi:PIN domain-containing protein [Roseibium album]|uniref:DUF4935 domain-containing protein n=1 Tax=Roseibium album TaxID=311410 RepID=A0A0M6Z608_9HYPH|nr:PIN domain-containing protein [Roseibium album]CTQ58139.1 hypothetical protein LA5094_00896 [Roseibium album]CTQ65663.1 hypothetical protein LA5096_00807 [Roseibium album]CTQ70543.1 hypothetical protein LA5095_01951 [Roseibium album]
MLHILIDTCVWLDLAKDYRKQTIIRAVHELVESRQIKIIVPKIVKDEFARNKSRVAEQAQSSLQAHFKLVREVVDRFAEDDYKMHTLNSLNETNQRIAMKGEAVNDSIKWIEGLLTAGIWKATTQEIKQRVTERALAGRAPYHRSKNSVGDAVIIETYAEITNANTKRVKFAFVTHNIRDFSQPAGDQRKPHPDLQPLFDGARSTYWTSLAELLKAEFTEDLDDLVADSNWFDEPRRLSEILVATHLLEKQIWYNRHRNLIVRIAKGKTKVVSFEEWEAADPRERNRTLVVDSIWERALRAARRTEIEVGIENLGPWDDFEWGMINGKLSALRWVTGDDWDMLDT